MTNFGAFPSPSEKYSRENEAQFRAAVMRALRDITDFTIPEVAPDLVDNVTLGAGDNDNIALDDEVLTLRATPNAGGSNVTGFTNGTDARKLRLINLGPADIVVVHQDAGSTAANRIITPDAASWTLAAADVVDFEYDDTTDRWRLVEIAVVAPESLPRLTDLTIAVADDGADDEYDVTWGVSAEVDNSYSLDLWLFRNGLVTLATNEGSPATTSALNAVDTGAGDGVSDSHWVVANLMNPGGEVIWSMTAACVSTI